MPYKLQGNNVLHFKNGKWTVKQKAKSKLSAMKAIRLLNAIDHGFKPSK